ncbi:lipase 3 isoform X1 [Diachasma alloeum]|uniref:lipase 3 isoform X1 n=1 Tax=Diachasma alloeum TaxID=454923 RepID=UPI00073841D4|nr:lipase 3 isoform X1 [Diachasma alloeum]
MVLSLIIFICSMQLFTGGFSKPVTPASGHLNFTELVERHGYTAESHVVTTDDGYNIRIDRISGSPSSPEAPGKPIVYLLHGIGVASEAWVLWDPNNSLAFLLADAGYDVWLANMRGTTNGRSHRTLNPDEDNEFWDFDLTTIATRDLPAQIDFILDRTGESKLTIIGHSMGTTLSYIFLSEKPEYNKSVNLVVSLAPIAYWHPKTLGLIRILMNASFHTVKLLVNGPHMNAEVIPHGPHVLKFADDYCDPKISDLCIKLMNLFMQQSKTSLSFEEIRHLLEYAPAGASLKMLYHYLQNVNSGGFHKYDYESSAANLQHYGQRTPPEYNLRNVEAPVVLIYIKTDFFAPEISTRILEEHLPNVVVSEAVRDKDFIHSDFILHKNGGDIIHGRVIQLIDEILKIKKKL